MSGPLEIFSVGQAATADDLQRAALDASNADNLALQALLPPGAVPSGSPVGTKSGRRVVPLMAEFGAIGYVGHAKRLVFPGGSPDNGKLLIRPALYEIGEYRETSTDAPTQAKVVLSIETQTTSKTALLDATVGNNRIDVVYATVSMAESLRADRNVKDVTSGAVSVQSLQLQQKPTVTFAIAKGTEGASPAVPSIPADGSGAYTIELARIHLSHPYTSGTTVDPTWVEQSWPGGGFPPALLQAWELGSLAADTGNAYYVATKLSPRCASFRRKVFQIRHATTSPGQVTLDDSMDYRFRRIRITMSAPWFGVGFEDMPRVEDALVPSQGLQLDSGIRFTGRGHFGGYPAVWAPTTVGPSYEFDVDASTGALLFKAVGDPLAGIGFVDHLWVEVEVSDQLRHL